MKKKRDELKLLLLQFRLAPEMREQEVGCYLRFGELKREQIKDVYILEEDFDINDPKDFDAVVVGGTGDFSVPEVKEKYPKAYDSLKEIALYCRENKIPVLTVCMQFWAVLFGGESITDPSKREVGTFKIHLTEEGKRDRLFEGMPDSFMAQVGHKDYVSGLPEGAVLLAYSDLCPTHAYRIGDREYYTQFHPELSRKEVVERMKFYRSYMPEDPEEFQKMVDDVEETPISASLTKKFIDRIVLNS